MKPFFIGIFMLLASMGLAQTEVDTSIIYKIVEEMPLVSNCARWDTTYEMQRQCSQEVLLKFIYQNVRYPDSARLQGIEGTVVINFVVNPDSTLSDAKIIRDIGGGCGAAALYVVNAINYLGLKWAPGKKAGVPVKVAMNIPVKFKIKEIPPYELVEGDTVYTQFEKPLSFKGGNEALAQFLANTLKYPVTGNDSCLVGTIEVKALIQTNGVTRVLEINDFNNLGMDYQFEAINATTSTIGQWEAAEYQGRKVPAAYLLRMDFKPTAEKCAAKVSDFEKAAQIALEGSTLFNEGKQEAGLIKLNEAIALFPNNAEFLYARGQAHIEMQNFEQACQDLTKVKEILLVTWVDHLLPIICGSAEK